MLFTGATATALFTFFTALYIFQIDTQFAHAILESWGLNYNKGGLPIILFSVTMVFFTTLLITLTFMQLLKDSWNTSQEELK